MTKEEYHKKIEALNKEYFNRVKIVNLDYAKEHAIAKKGDIVVSNTGVSIEVTGFILNKGYYSNMPYLTYEGYILTKKGTRRKNQEMAAIAPMNVASVNGKEVHYEQD